MAILVLGLGLLPFSAELQAGEHRIGGGVNYWTTVDDIDHDDIDEDGFSYLISYQHWWNILGLEVDFELLPDRFGETAFAPQAYVLFGSTLYGGAGIGIVNYDGDFADEPFYALRVGLNLELLPSIFVDISANYRFNDTADLDNKEKDIDTDTIFLGAAVRFAL
ncbi:MAG TPA: hypothetical protein ENN06_08295 [Desulfobacteraceae bacterium]|nr:hypothetical protein [Desulfobacteraceae bacterium]